MKKFRVTLCRTYYAIGSEVVEAENEDEAIEIARECCEDFSTKTFDDVDEVVSCIEER